MSAILLSSARPIAPGTFFQMSKAKTIRTASATQPPGLSQKAVGSAASGVSATAAIRSALDIELRLHRRHGLFLVHGNARQLLNHVLRRFGGNRFNLGPGGRDRVADLRLGGVDLDVDLVGSRLDLRLGVEPALCLRLLRNARSIGTCRIHSLAPRGFSLVSGDARL